jgi:hypothetical protein
VCAPTNHSMPGSAVWGLVWGALHPTCVSCCTLLPVLYCSCAVLPIFCTAPVLYCLQLRAGYLKNEPMANRGQTYTAIRKLMSSLDDPFTRFLEPSRLAALRRGTAGRIRRCILAFLHIWVDKRCCKLHAYILATDVHNSTHTCCTVDAVSPSLCAGRGRPLITVC